MSLRKLCHIVPRDVPWVGVRADRLIQTMCGLPRAQIIGLFDHHCVRVNGADCIFPGLRAVTGDQIQLEFDPARKYNSIPRQRQRWGFDLVFEDRYLLVVQKPADVLTIPTRREEKDTLLGRVTRYVRKPSNQKDKGPALSKTLDSKEWARRSPSSTPSARMPSSDTWAIRAPTSFVAAKSDN